MTTESTSSNSVLVSGFSTDSFLTRERRCEPADFTLAQEPLSLVELQAYVEAYNILPEYRRLRNRLFYFLEQRRADRILRTLDQERIRTYLQDSHTRLLPFKVIQLSCWIRRLRPKVILELGAGGSTILFAELLEKHGIDGKVIALEQNPQYYEEITRAIPEGLRHRIDIRLCPTRYERIEGFRCLSYEHPTDLPREIDFVYIDGPSPQAGCPLTEAHPYFNGDLYLLARKGITCRFAVNDGRWFNLGFFRITMRALYRFKPTVRYRSFLIENRNVKPSVWAWSRLWNPT